MCAVTAFRASSSTRWQLNNKNRRPPHNDNRKVIRSTHCDTISQLFATACTAFLHVETYATAITAVTRANDLVRLQVVRSEPMEQLIGRSIGHGCAISSSFLLRLTNFYGMLYRGIRGERINGEEDEARGRPKWIGLERRLVRGGSAYGKLNRSEASGLRLTYSLASSSVKNLFIYLKYVC